MDRGYVVASGRGTIFSFLVHHAPQLPGRELPLTIALVELEEGVRFVADVRGNPEDLAIGDSVVVGWDRVDDELTLPVWEVRRMTASAPSCPSGSCRSRPTLVVSTAIATRDYQDVHHDRDLAQSHGSQGHLREHPRHHRAGAEVRR